MKNGGKYIVLLKIFFDFAIAFSSFFVAKGIRLVLDLDLPFQTLHNSDLFNYALQSSFILIIVFGIHGLYKFDLKLTRLLGFSKIILYSFYSFVFFSVSVYLTQDFIFNTALPRGILLISFFITILGVILNRFIINFISNKIWKKSKVLIFSNSSTDDFYELIKGFKKSNNYKVEGVANNYKLGLIGIKEYNFEKAKKLIKEKKIDEILYINSDLGKEDLLELWELTRIFGIKYKYVANSFDLAKSNTIMTLMDNIPVLEIKNTSLLGWNNIIKRLFDIIVASIAIIIFSPLLIVVAILIKKEDPDGPVVFKNKRVGKDGKEFDLFKFRYMKWKFCTKESYKVSEEEKKEALEYEEKLIKEKSTRSGPLYKIQNDPRKTKIGAFIEKYSIDELPQLFNVILGNMSIVGPRPHQPREVEKYEIAHMRLLVIKPGITGMAQVNGREENTFNDEANLDIYYIDNWSLLFDFKIIFKTIGVVVKRK